MGVTNPRLEVLSAVRKQAEQAMRSNPARSTLLLYDLWVNSYLYISALTSLDDWLQAIKWRNEDRRKNLINQAIKN